MTQERKKLYCAVYTRKSSEEGLEQEFNSLDAQREAGESYVNSQKHEGWELLPDRYDDDGISGGTMERPGLQRLLTDVEAGKVNVIVVYKVDRLSRSLGDFAQMANLFDRQNVSFVSVTQQFNTTTSMGRLTLNVLLSFAQFEREVASERIRDKIAASKKRGMWMGGYPPLGYDIEERNLIVNLQEADLVRRIFIRFVQSGSTTRLCKELNREGFRTKRFRRRSGQMDGGIPFTKTTLYKILKNRIYLGEVRHKDQWYPGAHEAIIELSLFEKAQNIIKENPRQRAHDNKRQTPAPLKGLLFGPDGKAMTPTHSKRQGRLYRYYVTSTANKTSHEECPISMVRAGDIEGIIFDQLKHVFRSPEIIVRTWEATRKEDSSIKVDDIRKGLQSIETVWDNLFHNEQTRLLKLFIEKVQLTTEGIHIDMHTNGLSSLIMDIKAEQNRQKRARA